MSTAVLTAENLRCVSGGAPVLDGVTLALYPGHIYGLVGDPGSGKTAFLRCVAGLIPLESGSAAINGVSVAEAASRRETGMLVHEPALWNELSVPGNLEMMGRILGKPDRKRMGKLMKALEILPRQTGRRSAGSCPASVKLRLGTAMALLGSPKLLMLDNIFSGLDSDDALRMTELLVSETAEREMATLVTSPYLAALWPLATDYLFLHGGRISGKYTREELSSRLTGEPGPETLQALQEALKKEAGA